MISRPAVTPERDRDVPAKVHREESSHAQGVSLRTSAARATTAGGAPSAARTEERPPTKQHGSESAGDPDEPTELAKRAGLVLGLMLFVAMLAIPPPSGLSVEGQRVAAIAVLMATWWMTEALPLPATALLPIVLFPGLGVMTTGNATAPYGDPLVFLLAGGFFIAVAMQRWNLHRRIALTVVTIVGTEPKQLVFGFMLATAFLSAWISNTASTVMMLPIAMAVLAVVDTPERGTLKTALMLAIAYAASIGGITTLIGTAPNAMFAAAAAEITGRTIGFLDWMLVGVPLAAVMLVLTWFLLVNVLFRVPNGGSGRESVTNAINEQRAALGPISTGERLTSIVFALTALGWIFRAPKDIGGVTIPGLESFIPFVTDATIAIASAVTLFALPVSVRRTEFVLNWDWAVRIPWGILLLLGGGLSLATGFEVSGLATWIGGQVEPLSVLPTVLFLGCIVGLFILLTELTSNTATATMGMPIVAGVAIGIGADPLSLMAATAFACSMAFMLPVATPPNAIVFGSGWISIRQMARAGAWLNLISVILVTITIYTLFSFVIVRVP